jgi:hypothetical protein
MGSVSAPSCGVSAPAVPPSRTLLPAAVAALLVAAGFVALVAGSRTYVSARPAAEEPYNQVVEGFRSGHLWMAKEAPPALAAAANPYAFSAYRGYLAPPWRLIDLSYYRGHLYAYFGVTPAVILFWPWRALVGAPLHQAWAVLLFSIVGYAVSVGLAVSAWRRYFPGATPWAPAAAALVLGSATTLPVFLVRPGLYEVSISCGFMLVMLSLAALWNSWHGAEAKAAWLAAASLAYGLAVGARPTLLFGAVILLVPAWTAFVSHRRGFPAPPWPRILAAATLPIAAVGAGLAWYNAARFGNPLQFGHDYQLSGNDVFGKPSFGLEFLWDNVRLYFLAPLRWHTGFPYVWKPVLPMLSPNHLPVEFFFGTLVNLPVLLAAALLLTPRAGTGFGEISRVALVLFAVTALPICLYAGATSRYLVDFLPALALVAAMGFVGVEASATQKTTEVAALRGVMRAALAYSVAVGWLLAVALGMFYRGAEEGTRLLAEGKIDEASVVYGRVCLINPDFKGPAELAVGTALVNGGRAAEGEGFLVSAIKHAPLDGAAHYALGQALLAQGRLKEAEAAFGTATALDPLDAAAEADLGVAIYRQGRIREAIGHEKAALRIDPSLADARRILTALEGLGDH